VIPGVPAIMRDVTARFEGCSHPGKTSKLRTRYHAGKSRRGLCTYGETILHDRTFDTANGRVR
jgi:hypothetical protein